MPKNLRSFMSKNHDNQASQNSKTTPRPYNQSAKNEADKAAKSEPEFALSGQSYFCNYVRGRAAIAVEL